MRYAVFWALQACSSCPDAKKINEPPTDPCVAAPSSVGCPKEIVSFRISPASMQFGASARQLQASVTLVHKDSTAESPTSVTWSVGDTRVARVQGNGATATVESVGHGTTEVQASASAGGTTFSKSLPVSVKLIQKVTIVQPSSTSLGIGQVLQLTDSVTADPAAVRTVTWSSANVSVATVSGPGVVTGIGAGHVLIFASSTVDPSVKDSIAIDVTAAISPVARVQLTLSPSCVAVGAHAQATAIAFDATNAPLTGRTIVFASASPAVASVNSSNGDVTGVSIGSAEISATAEGVTTRATLRVTNLVASVRVTLNSQSLRIGETTQGVAIPLDCFGAQLSGRPAPTWRSGNPAVASVTQGGVVTAIAAGQADIFAAVDGVEGKSTVTVASSTPTQSIQLLSSPTLNGVVLTLVAPVRVRVIDNNSAPVPNVQVRFAVRPGGGVVQSGANSGPSVTVTSDVSGNASVEWTLGVDEGAQLLDVALTATPAVLTTITATATDPLFAIELAPGALSAQSGTIFADVPTPPAVLVKKKSGKPASGIDVLFATGGTGSVTPTTLKTDASGVARVTAWKLGPTLGAQSLTAEVTSLTARTFAATAGAPDLAVALPAGPYRTSTPYNVLVTVRDALGNVIPNATVDFTNNGGGAFSPINANANGSGVASTFWTLGTSLATYSGTARVGNAPPKAINATTTLPSTTRGIVQGKIVQKTTGGADVPITGATVTIGRLTFTYTTPPTPGSGDYSTTDLTPGIYVITLSTIVSGISETHYAVPVNGGIVTNRIVHYTSGKTSGPIEFQLSGSLAADPGTNIAVWVGSGGDGTEPGRPVFPDALTRDNNTKTKWFASTLEGYYLVKVTLPGGNPPVYQDCAFDTGLGGSAKVCTINVP